MKTIEVYKTNVNKLSSASVILEEIRQTHPNSDPSFDLEDCDKVLRVEDSSGVDNSVIQEIIRSHGFQIDTLL
ncbi:MAG: hypothetical protein R3220_13285 [Balneolaceae bacterium]|nr:hypothetical protein [Balneolaceae bacterium]